MTLPITILVDDPAPLINVYWWHAATRAGGNQPIQGSGEPVAREIPIDFLAEFIEVIERWRIRGKFSVLPYPAGLGPVDRGWAGCDRGAMAQWLELVRRRVTPLMDITPEILTHARAVDLDSMALLEENERDWSRRQSAVSMTPYISLALEILNRVGLPAAGVTSPWNFGAEVEEEYGLAIRGAMDRVNGCSRSWYFLHSDNRGTASRSEVVWRDGDAWLVSLWAQGGDYLGDTMETQACDEEHVAGVADAYLTEDGRGGRLSELFEARTPMVLCTHWQSLFSNGRRTGLRVLDEVCRRVDQTWGDQVVWTRCGQLAEDVASGRYGG